MMTSQPYELTWEELEALGPSAEPPPPAAWTREEYRAWMVARGIADYDGPDGTGIETFLDLAEEFGLLEKRPNTLHLDLVPTQRGAGDMTYGQP
ncbi:hypothetical protein [Nonomuraea longicatena]|uniref:Uncharacterized protein n=1 Tax=Nonomuraea longicatena TaxID=83682 RepID=A0ABP4BVJ0_9ACTN